MDAWKDKRDGYSGDVYRMESLQPLFDRRKVSLGVAGSSHPFGQGRALREECHELEL